MRCILYLRNISFSSVSGSILARRSVSILFEFGSVRFAERYGFYFGSGSVRFPSLVVAHCCDDSLYSPVGGR